MHVYLSFPVVTLASNVYQVSDIQFGGRELEICKWEGDAEELLRGVREKLNALGEVSKIFSPMLCIFFGCGG